jgi:competence CoiA-like predicted nuclease
MGYMTEIGILNDRWDEIRKEPAKFVEQIYDSSMSNGRTPQWIVGQTTVAKTHHADDWKVYLAHQNSFVEAYPDRDFDERRLKYHLKDLSIMKDYLKTCERETKRLLAKAEGK